MMCIIFIFLFQICFDMYTLNIDDIFLYKENNENNIKNYFSIILSLNEMVIEIDILNNLFLKDILVIKIESENLEKIKFECDFFGPTSKMNSYINSNSKDNLSSNLKSPFYFRKEHFEKSFIINFNRKN